MKLHVFPNKRHKDESPGNNQDHRAQEEEVMKLLESLGACDIKRQFVQNDK
jgi:hypothetical protein